MGSKDPLYIIYSLANQSLDEIPNTPENKMMLTIANFIAQKDNFIERQFDDSHLKVLGSLTFPKLKMYKIFADYVRNNSERLIIKQNSVEFDTSDPNYAKFFENPISIFEINNMIDAVRIINMVRGAIAHGDYTLDVRNNDILFDYMNTDNPNDVYGLKLKLPISILNEVFKLEYKYNDYRVLQYKMNNFMNLSESGRIMYIAKRTTKPNILVHAGAKKFIEAAKSCSDKEILNPDNVYWFMVYMESPSIDLNTKFIMYEAYYKRYERIRNAQDIDDNVKNISDLNNNQKDVRFSLVYTYMVMLFSRLDKGSNAFSNKIELVDFSKARIDDRELIKTKENEREKVYIKEMEDKYYYRILRAFYKKVRKKLNDYSSSEKGKQAIKQAIVKQFNETIEELINAIKIRKERYMTKIRNSVYHFTLSYSPYKDEFTFSDVEQKSITFSLRMKTEDLLEILNERFNYNFNLEEAPLKDEVSIEQKRREIVLTTLDSMIRSNTQFKSDEQRETYVNNMTAINNFVQFGELDSFTSGPKFV